MKQVLQQTRTGEIGVNEVPAPKVLPGCVLVRIAASLISAGTERASSEFASKNLLRKAKVRPDLVREVLAKVRRDGLFSTIAAVRGRLDQFGALGYSSAGTVIQVGDGVADLQVGDHVACSGTGYAVHAEFACVPRLLAARVPIESSVTPEEAAFATMGAIAMHGIRNAEARLGDVVAVIGLGLVGQLTVQLLKAAGCRVLGMDLVAQRAELARRMGADAVCVAGDELRDLCLSHSGGNGADAVIITAETPSSDPVNLAADVARDRGVVVAVGTVGMSIDRKVYYAKELDFRVSRSYGPGRYDSTYEQKGRDYPIGYVRWTETRNMEAFVRLLADGKLDLRSLITHRFPIDRAPEAYDVITGRRAESFLGVLVTYPGGAEPSHDLQLVRNVVAARPEQSVRSFAALKVSAADSRFARARKTPQVSIGILGAGAFARTTLLPAMKRIRNVDRIAVCAATGIHARQAACKFGFRYCATDEEHILSDDSVNAVVIATRHHLHAKQVLHALAAGKHVFCEKPLCITEAELAEIVQVYDGLLSKPVLMVGFNRRFAPMAIRMKAFLDGTDEPLVMHYRVNAGSLPRDHWVNDPEQGGGRILGEVCHFVDFLSFLANAAPIEVHTQAVISAQPDAEDNAVISIRFANGSMGTVSYLSNGDRTYSKERLEVFAGGAVAVLTDFRRLELVRHGRKRVIKPHFRQDKGHRAELGAFVSAIRSGSEAPIPFDKIVSTTLATLRAEDSRRCGQPAVVDTADFLASHSSSFRATS
jgi:predicted dehydrogenase/threonine dehydrogenase-like Zn-dependent dehydrogenase